MATAQSNIERNTWQIDPLVFPYPVQPKDVIVQFTYLGQPKTAQIANRENISGKSNYRQALSGLINQFKATKVVDSQSRFSLRCLFFRDSRQKIDCDNLLKAVSDSATGIIWKDDSQVGEIYGKLFLFATPPRVEVVIYKIDDPSQRPECPTCGNPVIAYPSRKVTYCSLICRNKPLRVTSLCKQCNESFELPRSVARVNKGFCSRRCTSKFYGQRKSNYRGRATWKCGDCGGAVSRKEYKVCRACSMKHRGDPSSNYWKLRHKN